MVYIFSIENDFSTSEVIDWILYFGYDYCRINSFVDLNKYLTENVIISNTELNLEVTSVWYRRTPKLDLPSNITENPSVDICIREYARSEQLGLFNSVFSRFHDKRWLNNWNNCSPGKFYQLLLAEMAGLNVPNTCIVNTKKQLQLFKDKNKEIIIKSIQDIVPFEINGDSYMQYTKILEDSDIDELTDCFFPCLCQKAIDKNHEIRTFFIDGHCYSMAICSSFDEQTKVDFRRYNDKYPNRTVPYQLPKQIEQNICDFMKAMDLNCGSLDLILDNSGAFYFLEVNPVGQFGMVSYPCNYYLEREIARFLTTQN